MAGHHGGADELGSDVLDDTGTVTALAAVPERVLHSDPHDFAGLYIRHRSSLTMHARRHLNDVRDADEVVQEAFLRLFLALPELGTELQALAYCRRTITNLCIDRYRAAARRPDLVDLESVPQETFADHDPGDPVVRAEDAALIREALSRLPDLHRAALVKREIEEKALPVIADELDIPEDNVKHLLFRARRALRKMLAGTSLAPGVDVEHGRALSGAPRVRSGGLAGLLVLLAIGLGSGPDLEAVPVVGVDLPDVIGVTRLADAIGEAVTDVVARVTTDEPAEAAAVGRTTTAPAQLGDSSSTPARESSDAPAGAPAGPAAGPASGAQAPSSTSAVAPAGTPSRQAAGAGGAPATTPSLGPLPVLPLEQVPAAASARTDVGDLLADEPRGAGRGTAERPSAAQLPAGRGTAPPVVPGRDDLPAKAARPQGSAPGQGSVEPGIDEVQVSSAAPTGPRAGVEAKPKARSEAALDRPVAAVARPGVRLGASVAKDAGRPAAAVAPAAAAKADAAAKAEVKQTRVEDRAEAKVAKTAAKAEVKQTRVEDRAEAKVAKTAAKAEAKQKPVEPVAVEPVAEPAVVLP